MYCVNDGAVMEAWAADQGVEGSMVTFLADTRRELTEALGMTMHHEGPLHALGNLRCKRFALFCDDGVIKVSWNPGPGASGRAPGWLKGRHCRPPSLLLPPLSLPPSCRLTPSPTPLRCSGAALAAALSGYQVEAVSEAPDDPAGGADPSASCVDAVLEKIKTL